MIAALLYSTKVCEGPRVCRRDFKTARIKGAGEGDIIAIGAVHIAGSGELPIENEGKFIRVVHKQASGNPVTVELM